MKKSLHILLIAVFVYVLFSFTSVYAESTIPMVAVTYRLENDGHYKSLEGVTFTSDADSIDFTYTTVVGDIQKTFTTSFVKNGNIFTYTHKGSKTNVEAYYQALLDDVAVNAMFYAIGSASAIANDHLANMAKDFSVYNYTNYGFEVKTYDYTNTINGKEVSIKAIDSFTMNAAELSVYGNANIAPIVKNETVTEPVEKGNQTKTIVLVVVLVLVILLVVALVVKSKKAKPAAKKATTKKATSKKTK